MGNETNDLQTELLEISTKLNQATAILNAFGEGALMMQKTVSKDEATILRANHEQNGYLYFSATEYLQDAITKLNELMKTM